MDPSAWSMAMALVAIHGEATPYVLHSYITSLRRDLADERVISQWLLVDQGVHELVRKAPRGAERIH
jgi:hypothetical protein